MGAEESLNDLQDSVSSPTYLFCFETKRLVLFYFRKIHFAVSQEFLMNFKESC